MKIHIYKTLDQNIMNEWLALWEKSAFANYANSPLSFVSAVRTYHYNDFVIIAVYKNEQLEAIGALVKSKKYGIDCYSVEPADFICGIPFLLDMDNKEALQSFITTLRELGTICLENIPEMFVEAFKNKNELTATVSTSNNYLKINKNEKGEVNIPHKRRLLRRSEIIEKELTLHVYKGLDKKALETAFAIDRKSTKQVFGYNAFSNEQTVAFYKYLQEEFKNHFLLFILKHKKKTIAYQIGFHIGSTFFCSQIAFLKEYESYSIGRSLLIRLIEYLGNAGIQTIDFGSGDDHVKRSLTKEKRNLYSLIMSKSEGKRKYISYMNTTRNYLYSFLHKNKRIYAIYRKSKKI